MFVLLSDCGRDAEEHQTDISHPCEGWSDGGGVGSVMGWGGEGGVSF